MTAQPDLFADTPRARNSDPATSHRAAERVKLTGALGRQQALVRDLVQRFPGHTSAELAMHHALERGQGAGGWALYRPMIARRLPELAPVHVRKGEARVCDVTGQQSLTWWPA